MQRKDATLTTRGKRATIFCTNASRLGYSKQSASPGDLITFTTGEDRTYYGRVLGRVDAPAFKCSAGDQDAVKGWLCVVMVSSSMHSAHEMWVNPDHVTNIESPTEGHVRFWQAFLTGDPQELLRMAEYGSLSAYGTCTLPSVSVPVSNTPTVTDR